MKEAFLAKIQEQERKKENEKLLPEPKSPASEKLSISWHVWEMPESLKNWRKDKEGDREQESQLNGRKRKKSENSGRPYYKPQTEEQQMKVTRKACDQEWRF